MAAIGGGALAVFTTHPDAFHALKLLGSLYVLWLAWNLFRSGGQDAAAEAAPAGFGTGVLLLMFNPKAYLIIALMFSQFVTDAQGTADWQLVLVITTVFTLNNLLAFLAWTTVGNRLAKQCREEQTAKWINRTFRSVLAAVAVWMAFG